MTLEVIGTLDVPLQDAGGMSHENDTLIRAFFETDHRDIEAIYDSIRFEAVSAALPLFEEFDRRLETHIEWEEELLFPLAASKQPWLADGPIVVMKTEHVAIRREKAAVLAALRAGDGAAARARASVLQAVLSEHNMKEEHVLYPACDESIPAEEKRSLKAKLKPR